MNAHTIYKIAIRLFLGGALSVALNPVMALTISQLPLTVGSSGAKPNIMIMLDNSGSMGTDNIITTTPATNISPNDMATKAPDFSYSCTSEISAGAATSAAVSSTDAMKIISGVVKFCKVSTDCSNSTKQYDFGTASPQKCFNNNKWYKVKYYNGSTLENKAFLGKNLNWYFSTGGFPTGASDLKKSTVAIKTTRMIIAKTAANNLVTSLLNDNAAVRLGLSTFDRPDSNGGQLLVAMGDLNTAQAKLITDAIGTATLDSSDNEIDTGLIRPSGYTPLGETLADIGRYFCIGNTGNLTLPKTGASLSLDAIFTNGSVNGLQNNTSPLISPLPAPIQYPNCQKSAVILITDGLPTKDTDISTHLKTYSGSRTPVYSDYLDDIAQALFEMDLRPDSTIKNNLKTYAIGIADPELNAESVLKEAAWRGGGTFEFADNYQALADSLDKMVADIQKGVGSFSAIVANSTQLGTDAALFQAKYDTTDWTGDFIALPVDANGFVGDPAWNAGSRIPTWDSTSKTSPRNIFTTTYPSTAPKTPKAVSFKGKTGVTICNEILADVNQQGALAIGACNTTDPGVWRLDYLRGDTSHEKINALHPTYTDPRASNGTLAADRVFRNRARFYGDNPPAPHKTGEVYKKDDGTTPADPWLLGDIVNSDGVYVSNQNQGYDKLTGMSATEKSSYQAFVSNKNSRRKMVYIGANDAMLHGFDASISTTDAGKEILAYMPNSVFDANGRLISLSAPDYAHKYFVDGSPKVGDAYFDGVWHTVLVGTTGAGGHGVFALDVTDPKYDPSEANHFPVAYNNTVLWEVSDTDAPKATDVTDTNGFAANMGYSLPQPSIAKMADGSWAAIVSNGYPSSNNHAVLFIIDIKTGNLIKTIDTGVGSATQPNGLSTPFVADVNADGVADAIYAGDLSGNLWKFDVSDKLPSNWNVAYNKSGVAAPLFIACSNITSTTTCDASRQPITSKPVVGRVKSPQTTGVMAYFGTGKYFEDTDNNTTDTQSFYGIWDECPLVSDTTASRSPCSTTVLKNDTVLQKQSITDETPVPPATPTVRVTSNTATDYANKKGWYMDFINPNTNKNEGERVVSAPVLRSGRIIFVTLIPMPASSTDPCAGASGTGWFMALDALSGSRLPDNAPAFDVTGDRKVTSGASGDLVSTKSGNLAAASGLKLTGGSSDTPVFMKDPANKGQSYGFTGDSSGGKPEGLPFKEPVDSKTGAGRQSWRQLE